MVGAAGSALGRQTNHHSLANQRHNLATQVLLGGNVYTMDPAHPRATAVAFRDGRILAVGTDKDMRRYISPHFTEVRDVHGLVITPGFIDPHMHLRGKVLLPALRMCEWESPPWPRAFVAAQTQTSRSSSPTRTATGFAPNVVTYIGASTLRAAVGVPDEYTAATPAQIRQMVGLADQAMKDGAIGVSFGIEYEPGTSYEEIVALARVAAAHKGHISAHIRYPDPDRQHALCRQRDHASRQGCRLPRPDISPGAYGLRRDAGDALPQLRLRVPMVKTLPQTPTRTTLGRPGSRLPPSMTLVSGTSHTKTSR